MLEDKKDIEIVVDVPVTDEDNYPDEKIIEWNDILTKEGEYFVYIYSKKCLYCIQMKDLVLSFNEISLKNIYFVEFKDDIPLNPDIETTIGAKQKDNIFIKGVPSLLEVKNGEIIGNYAGPKEIINILTNS